MLAQLFLAASFTLALSKTIQVSVGENGTLAYNPEYVQADVGDIVSFTFHPKNHTVTQSSFDTPCIQSVGGVNSGFFAITSENDYLPTFQYRVNDVNPVWFFCAQTGHCSRGMVFAINPPANGTDMSFANFKARAIQSASGGSGPAPAKVLQAVVSLRGDSNVTGTLRFAQSAGGGNVTIQGNITGLDPNALRGMHIHQFGDLTNGCNTTSTHFNPFNQTHGGPNDVVRHVGDLGNIQSDAYGVAVINISDGIISLSGVTNVIGRGIVVHAMTDDLGKGGNEESLRTGNAGARLACGVIGIAG